MGIYFPAAQIEKGACTNATIRDMVHHATSSFAGSTRPAKRWKKNSLIRQLNRSLVPVIGVNLRAMQD